MHSWFLMPNIAHLPTSEARLLNKRYIITSPPTSNLGNAHVGRLNRVLSLFTAFEEPSQVTSPFWSRDKMKRGIRLFHEQDFELSRYSNSLRPENSWSLPSLYSKPEKSKWFPSLCCIDFSVCSLNVCDSCVA